MTHLKIDYVELASGNIGATRMFLEKAFAWTFTHYGPDYQALANAGIDGGVFAAKENETLKPPLIILKTDNLAAAEEAVTAAGGVITQAPFDFPGGRRFHFREPGGNEMAVWCES